MFFFKNELQFTSVNLLVVWNYKYIIKYTM